MAFRPGNWKLRGLNVCALFQERWQLATRNNFSRNSAGKRENSGKARREQSSYPLSAEVLVSNPTFHQFPKPGPNLRFSDRIAPCSAADFTFQLSGQDRTRSTAHRLSYYLPNRHKNNVQSLTTDRIDRI